MRIKRHSQQFTVSLVIVSLAIPQFGLAGSAELEGKSEKELPSRTEKVNAKITDVALDTGGTLRGQVVNANGIGESGVRVRLAQGFREIATTTTDTTGNFAIPNVAGGVYQVVTGNSDTAVRAWTDRAAPPSAQGSILVVNDQGVARGFAPMGMGGAGGGGFFGGSMFGLIVVGAVVATTVAVAVTTSNDSSS